jgi:hypothetical protein
MRISPSLGSPSSTSSHLITSGPPSSWTLMALAFTMMRSPEQRRRRRRREEEEEEGDGREREGVVTAKEGSSRWKRRMRGRRRGEEETQQVAVRVVIAGRRLPATTQPAALLTRLFFFTGQAHRHLLLGHFAIHICMYGLCLGLVQRREGGRSERSGWLAGFPEENTKELINTPHSQMMR